VATHRWILTLLPAAALVILAGCGGNYSESDDCPASLAPGSSCTLSVAFKPGTAGFIPGTLTINYTPEPTSVPQLVRLRGTGQ